MTEAAKSYTLNEVQYRATLMAAVSVFLKDVREISEEKLDDETMNGLGRMAIIRFSDINLDEFTALVDKGIKIAGLDKVEGFTK